MKTRAFGLILVASFALNTQLLAEEGGSASSANARSNKHVGIGARAGYVTSLLFGGGADLFYNHGSDWQFGGHYTTGSIDLKNQAKDTDTVRVDKIEVKANIIAGQVRYFVGNSFSIYGQVGQRVIQWDIGVSSKVSTDSIASTGTATSIYGGIGIGNVWVWDSGFFIGADWFGYFSPFASKSESSSTATGSVTADLEKINQDTEKLGKDLGKQSHVHLFVMNLGFML